MEKRAIVLACPTRSANNVDDGNALCIRASDGIDCGELAYTKRRTYRAQSMNSCIRVGSIACIELVTILYHCQCSFHLDAIIAISTYSHPCQSTTLHIIQQSQVEVASKSV